MISRRWAFIGAIIGIFVLLLIMIYSDEKKVNSQEEIDSLEINSKVILKGLVVSERKFGESVILELDNEIEVLCDSCGIGQVQFEEKEIEVKGKIYDVYGDKKVLAFRIVVLE